MNRFLPKLELLNDRVVPSCTIVQNGGVLTITGDSSDNDISIVDDGTTVKVTCDGEAQESFDNVTDIVVKAGNKDDNVSYSLTSDGVAVIDRTIKVRMGNGSDTFTGDVTGNLADGSSLKVDVRGCNGKDSLSFTSDGDVGAGSALSVLLGGGNGKDVIDSGFAGILLGDYTFSALGGNGKDEISIDATFDATSVGTADLKVEGNNAPDTLAMQVTDNSGDDGDPSTSDASTLDSSSSFVVDGGRAPDSVDASDNVEVLNAKH